MAGVVTAMTGFLLVYFLNARYNMRINPLFIALFAFTFAITMGVVWEIIEFSFDVLLKTDMQRWYVPHGTPLIGRDYQGNGLRDTMSDLIVSCVGALAVSVIVQQILISGCQRATLGRLRRLHDFGIARFSCDRQ